MSTSTFRHILCPVNFTTFSHDALDYAVDFARGHKAALIGVHVDPRQDATAETLASLQRQLSKVLKEAHAPRPAAVAVAGDEASEIVRLASWLSADLIVMPRFRCRRSTSHRCTSNGAYSPQRTDTSISGASI